MQDSQKIQWKRMAVEAVAIVVSILLAFSIDAWWDAKVEKAREHEILLSLADDFGTTRDSLVDGIRFHTAVRASNNELLAAVTSDQKPLSEADFDLFLLDLTWWDSTDPFTTGTVNSVIASGDLAIICNHEIRRMIADWPTKIAFAESTRRQDYDFFWSIWAPFLREKGYIPQLSEIEAPAPGRPYVRNPVAGFPINNRKSMSSIILDEEFHNLLSQKLWVQNDILVTFTNLIAHIDRINKLINSELGDGS